MRYRLTSKHASLSRSGKLLAAVVAVPLAAGFASSQARGADVYWDSNADTPGAGVTPTGIWGTDAFWTSDATGSTTPTAAWVAGDAAFFSAGSDATGAFTVGMNGTQTASAINIEEGTITLGPAGAVAIGAGTVNVATGATLVTNSSARISATTGAIYTLNNSTLRTTNPGAAGSFIDVDATITLNGGGTIDYTVPGVLNIIQTTSIISGTGPLTKTGVGIIALAAPSTYTGATIINDGELRLRGGTNRLPTGTALTINAPGILNVNGSGQNQTVASISGNGRIGLANGILTVGSGTFAGTVEDTANLGAGGATSVGGILSKNGTGTLTLTGANTHTGGINFTNGRINFNNNSAAGTGAITIGTGADDFASTAPGIVLANNMTLNAVAIRIFATTGNSLKQTGVIGGAGGLLRNDTGAGLLTLAGNNTFAGGVQLTSRDLVLGHANALGTGTFTIGDAVTAPPTPISFSAEADLSAANAVPNAVVVNRDFSVTGANAIELSGVVDLGAADRTINVSNSADTTFGTIQGAAGVTKSGAGKLISRKLKVSGAAAVTGGTLEITTNGTPTGMLEAGDVSVAAATLLQMNDNDMIVNYTGASPEFTLRDKVLLFRDGGGTEGIGFTETPEEDTILAFGEASELVIGTFNGVTIDDTTVVGKYTYYGDANFDGQVTTDDYVAVDLGLNTGDSWVEGDFDLNGVVTTDDYVVVDLNLGKGSGNPLAFADIQQEMIALHTEMFGQSYVDKLAYASEFGWVAASVPEPGAVSALGMGLLGLLRRRRRGC